MKICLFEWNAGGHHNFYAQAFATALAPRAEVVVAGSDPLLEALGEAPGERYSLGDARPRPGSGPGLDKASLAKRELELLRGAIETTAPDHAVVLFADPVLRWLAASPPFPCPISIFVMFASAHFPRAYGLPLTPRERASALFKERNIRRWRRRPDAHELFGLDAAAVEGWRRKRGAAARWLPEPRLEIEPRPLPAAERHGCFMFGYIDERKGIGHLAAALAEGYEGLELAIYGDVAPEYRDRLEAELATLRNGGVRLDTDLRRVPYADAMERMASCRCALLSFGWRPSGSRVLLEAAAARTPVVVGDDSAVGRLVERHGLGLTADPTDPAALGAAIMAIAGDPGAVATYEDNLRRYAEELHGDRFPLEVRAAFGLG
ncbi:MAG TPA: glycosyltransferase [Solirubrobacterales bacterium]|nr:glycosyltransferase [Solirubrobacterales bacterium]